MRELGWNWPAARVSRLIMAGALMALLLWLQSHFRLALVIGGSMLPGLNTGDLLLVNKKAYRKGEPARGDIVLAHYGQELIVKRVVGLPSEEVELERGHILVNGAVFPEPYPIQTGPLNISPGRLLPGRYAILGDNRAMSAYETVHAVVSKEQIVGKVTWSIHL